MSNLQADRERSFRELLLRLSKSPLYQNKFKPSSSVLESIGLNDIHRLPLTTKEDLRSGGAFGHLAVEQREIAQYHESFGTTGEPSASWFTLADLERGGQQMRECGVQLKADDLVLIRFPYAMSLPAFLMQQAAWQTGAGIVPASSRTAVSPYPRVLDLLGRLKVTVMAGLPREMELLAETARLLGNDPHKSFPALRAICVAGELLGEARRKHIERLWAVPVFNLYGSTETGNIAAMCEHGAMHIVERDFVVEVLKEDGSGPVGPGERGFAAVTTLRHEASPLLRYFNEDIISVETGSCPCGRAGGKLVHYGRRKDRLQLGGKVLDGKDVQEAVYSLNPAPDAWRAVEQPAGLHFLLDSHRLAEWSEQEVVRELSARLGVPVTVEIAAKGELLDREELLRNAPSKKPVYIQRLAAPAVRATAEEPLRDLLEQGRLRLAKQSYEEAKVCFEQAVALDSASAEAHAWLAAAYGRLMEAGSMLEKMRLLPLLESEIAAALALDPDYPFARRMNGARLLHTPETLGGSPAEALNEFLYYIEHGLDETDVWLSIAECYMKLNDTVNAADTLHKVLLREPGHEKALEWLQTLAGEESGS